MSFRAILLGVIGAVLMGAGAAYVNKYVPGVTGLVRGHLPVSVFGLLIFFVAIVNPLINLIRPSWRFRPGEIAVIMAMVLVSCSITDAGLLRHFPRSIMLPVIENATTHKVWQHDKVLDETPSIMLANDGKYDDAICGGYKRGIGQKDKFLAFSAVPWNAWQRSLVFWCTVIGLVMIAVVSLSVIIHRQWAEKERIRYPIAELASTLLKQNDRGIPLIFSNKLFWIGLLIPLLIRVVHGIWMWFPNSIDIPLTIDLSGLRAKFPEFMKTPGANFFTAVELFPACIGFTYLLSSEIGFSLGVSNFVSVFILFMLISIGIDVSGSQMTGGVMQWQNMGAFLAMGVMLLYIGRRYYWQTFKEAVSFTGHQETDRAGVWAFRTFILSVVGTVVVLSMAGMDWPIAGLAVFFTLLTYLVCARMNAECGTFFFAPSWMMPGVIVGLFGLTALGPKIMIILGLLMYVLTIDQFESLMPFAVNSLKIGTDANVKHGRTGLTIALTLLLVLSIAVPFILWAEYDHGVEMRRGAETVPVYDAASRVTTQLKLSGKLDEVHAYGAWDRLKAMRPEGDFLVAAAIGFFLLLACSALRLRYTWWPLHPVIVLAFASGPLAKFCASFFLGWMVKVAVNKFAGVTKYTEFKPLMIGLIVGDLSGSFLVMSGSWIYFLVTGTGGRHWLPW